jgi:hypothetical protein
MTPLETLRLAALAFESGRSAYLVTVKKAKRKSFQNSLGNAMRSKGLRYSIANYHARGGNVIIIKQKW